MASSRSPSPVLNLDDQLLLNLDNLALDNNDYYTVEEDDDLDRAYVSSSLHFTLYSFIFIFRGGTDGLDLEDFPLPFAIENPMQQEDILDRLFSADAAKVKARQDFFSQSPSKIKLSKLRELYDSDAITRPFSLLRKRHEIIVDPDYVLDPLDPELTWLPFSAYLDFLLVVPRDIGLTAIIPNGDHGVAFGYAFNHDVRRPTRRWRSKHARLGFNPSARMLWIGTCMDEDVWLAAAPSDILSGDHDEDEDDPKIGDTCLSRPHYHMWLLFLAAMLNAEGILGVYVRDRYPNDIHLSTSVTRNTNIL